MTWGLPAGVTSERGQTFTEFMMVSGLLVAVGLIVVGLLYTPAQAALQEVTQCIVDGSINGINCATGKAPTPPAP